MQHRKTNSILSVLLALIGLVFVAACAAPGDGPSGRSPDRVRVSLIVVGVDGEQFDGSPDDRWLSSFLEGETRDVQIALSETDDLMRDAEQRMRSAPGFRFMRRASVIVYAGSPAVVSDAQGAGSELSISVRPREVEPGLYELNARVSFEHQQSSGDGSISGVTFRAPALRYGTTPLTAPEGGARAVRLRREIGESIVPGDLQVFVFAKVEPVS